MTHNMCVMALLLVEWEAINYMQEPCCPRCSASLYGKNSAVAKYRGGKPHHTLEPGHHFPHCEVDMGLRTQADLQTPEERERVRRESYRPDERRKNYIDL